MVVSAVCAAYAADDERSKASVRAKVIVAMGPVVTAAAPPTIVTPSRQRDRRMAESSLSGGTGRPGDDAMTGDGACVTSSQLP